MKSPRYYKKKKAGECWRCKKKCVGGQVYCDEHRKERADNARCTRAARIRICPSCNKNHLGWMRKLCNECANPLGARYHAYQKQWRDNQKRAVFNAYGGAICACCSESQFLFLTLDHVNNDGAAHRKELPTTNGWKFWGWLKRRGYPAGYQVLCCNCNRGRWMNGGICPHKEMK